MVKVKGVMIFPAKIEEVLTGVPGASSEYQVIIDHVDGKDYVQILFETAEENKADVENAVRVAVKQKVGIMTDTKAVELGGLPRSEKKSVRIYDKRY